ncbi:hypothetical protein [Vibrio aestuarianus]|uniref:hypothetical protein n=1 Tax=Vibrio aestuarianus TaxID=28171 RepID=UPI001B34C455|nr:hypothetical protein [Vibrio aestuarianus]CAH8190108.1 hypothetical protein VIBAE_A30575 [Vibrio aestuarianus subsp. francensis]
MPLVSPVENKQKREEKVEEALLTIPICRVAHPSSKVSQPFPRRLLKTSGQTLVIAQPPTIARQSFHATMKSEHGRRTADQPHPFLRDCRDGARSSTSDLAELQSSKRDEKTVSQASQYPFLRSHSDGVRSSTSDLTELQSSEQLGAVNMRIESCLGKKSCSSGSGKQDLCLMETVSEPQNRHNRKDIQRSAALANYPYQQDLAVLRRDTDRLWELDLLGKDSDFKKVVEGLNLQISPSTGMFSDSNSGLVGFIFFNHTSKELRVVFGGTTSGEKIGRFSSRSTGNVSIMTQQWKANIQNGVFGKVPESYKQAKHLATEMVTVVEGEKYKDYSLSFSGHSKGGGEAAYAAVMVSTPDPLSCTVLLSCRLRPFDIA